MLHNHIDVRAVVALLRQWICRSQDHSSLYSRAGEKAEAEADQLKGWNAVYLSFLRYAPCDDGAIAEGYRDSVAKLLANHWAELQDLRRLTLESPEFSEFVMRHIDGLMSPDEAKLIEQNACLHCPAHGKALCRSILEQLKKAH